ncbi:NEDD8-activating enzyme E1 regulatory subunit-like isoform X2 [Liolophura sinensis]|uniref:NEDD8-activating enzyme E1 regulatory subunit-like isoform X2 n=1 Tax=Liolophura sinensis TaxID=3198878 RepID=UPI00315902C7
MATTVLHGKGKSAIDKSHKYDRQLRLWGDHGQASLESAKVCLINATAVGTEVLKNLILPGIGSFTIVDGGKVTGEDIGNNFFLCKNSIGKSRAQVATEYLAELNEDVDGHSVEESADVLLATDPSFFSSFSMVIATNLCEKVLLQLSAVLWKDEVPLLVCRSYGFLGYMRLAIKDHTVVESHPDNALEDLRLDQPFHDLEQFCDSLDLDSMTKKEHSHTPWLVLIYKYLQQWKAQHQGLPPQNYAQKRELKEEIRKGIHKNEEGVPEDEENFEEAILHLNSALVHTQIPPEVKKLLEHESCNNLHSESKPFWILVKALKDFTENEGQGQLPLRGTIPDMTADSERYIQLQNVYRKQAAKDVASVTRHVQKTLKELGKNLCSISEQDIKTFCRNAAFLRMIHCSSIAEEYNKETMKLREIANHLEDEDCDDLVFYVLIRGVDKFYEEYNRYPGWYNGQVETDIPLMKTCVSRLLHDWGLNASIKDDFIHEMCRYGAAELHTVSAFIGGAAAQEIIKVLTTQFLPINNTFIYNAMKQTSLTVEL